MSRCSRCTGVRIAPADTADRDLLHRWTKPGPRVSKELGGRYLIKYMPTAQVGRFVDGARGLHWTTPTPYGVDSLTIFLALPHPTMLRTHALLLLPARIEQIAGPRWVRHGFGVEYLLPDGFSKSAIATPTPDAEHKWEIVVA